MIAADVLASEGLDAEELAADDRARWDALVARIWPPRRRGRGRGCGPAARWRRIASM